MLSLLTLAWLGVAEPALTLDWRAPAGCPSRDEVVAALERVLPEHAPIPGEGRGRVHAEVEIVGQGERWQVELALTSERGLEQRSFAAERCELAAEATVLVIAVAIDPVATAGVYVQAEPEREPEPVAEREPEPVTEREPEPEPEREPAPEPDDTEIRLVLPDPEVELEPRRPRRSTSLGAALGLFGGGGLGPLRAGAGQLELRAALVGRHFRWQVRGAWLVPVEVALDDARSGRFDGWVIGTRGCGLPGGRLREGRRVSLEVPICAGLEGGQLRGEGARGVPNPVAVTRPYVALELGPALLVRPLERLAIGLELDAVVPLVQVGFSINGEAVLRSTPIGARVLVGVELRLP